MKSVHTRRLALVYALIWCVSVAVFWFFTDPTDALGYSVVILGVLLPVATLVISMLIAYGSHWNQWKWLLPPGFGISYMLAEYATFSAANMISNWQHSAFRMLVPEWRLMIVGAVIALVGLGIGTAIRKLNRR